MLSYAFSILSEQGYKKIATEKFADAAELFAAILAKGLAIQIKRGLYKDYIPRTEEKSLLRGKINMSESVKKQSMLLKRLVCTHDDFSVNSYMNKIIKSTAKILIKADIAKAYKSDLRKLMIYFNGVDTIDLYSANWNIQYNRNNKTYQMLIAVCRLVAEGLLHTEFDGSTKLMAFLDEQRICRLYEKFILAYYDRHFRKFGLKAAASQIKWQTDDGFCDRLPVMQSDIMLTYQDKTLIIDAKYYSKTMQERFGIKKLHSNNLYQIFTYVKNKEFELAAKPHCVSGLILYARTDESEQPNNTYMMSGNKITVRTLDLNLEFQEIAEELNKIAYEHFGIRR
jgi:5-methylcytosine-specific restriction enzyme subunit McrC